MGGRENIRPRGGARLGDRTEIPHQQEGRGNPTSRILVEPSASSSAPSSNCPWSKLADMASSPDSPLRHSRVRKWIHTNSATNRIRPQTLVTFPRGAGHGGAAGMWAHRQRPSTSCSCRTVIGASGGHDLPSTSHRRAFEPVGTPAIRLSESPGL